MSLEKKLDDFIVATEKNFQKVDERFQVMDERFQVMDERFQVMDERFQVMDERFQVMDQRFQEMDERFHAQGIMFENLTSEVKAYAEAVRKQTRQESLKNEYKKKVKKVDEDMEFLKAAFKVHIQDKKIHLQEVTPSTKSVEV